MLETILKKSDKNEECFDRLINRLNMSKERFSGLKDMSIEMNDSNRKTKEKKKNWNIKKCGTYSWLRSQRSVKMEEYKRNVLSSSGLEVFLN